MTLMERVTEDMKAAMKSKDKFRLGVIRMILAEFKVAMTAEQRITTLDDEQALKIVQKYRKKLVKGMASYPEGEKRDVIAQEVAIVETYLPAEQ